MQMAVSAKPVTPVLPRDMILLLRVVGGVAMDEVFADAGLWIDRVSEILKAAVGEIVEQRIVIMMLGQSEKPREAAKASVAPVAALEEVAARKRNIEDSYGLRSAICGLELNVRGCVCGQSEHTRAVLHGHRELWLAEKKRRPGRRGFRQR